MCSRDDAPVIRELTMDDLDQLVALDQQAALDPWSQEQIEQELNYGNALCLGGFKQGVLVGYLFCRWMGDSWHVMALGVDSACRRQGIASHLIKQSIRQAGPDAHYLEVRQSNLVAQALYIQLGFQQIGLRKGYYRDGEAAIVMRCPPGGIETL
ncbi:MAG: ribosomal protein S18-alanine N-acetyltransferase [Magnetococcales bacterium]|nr:ribosomal protein S18-alanine N-acetyltransferase [Magnetococcales bacterium]